MKVRNLMKFLKRNIQKIIPRIDNSNDILGDILFIKGIREFEDYIT